MGLFNRMHLRKIKRDEVVEALVELEKRQDRLLAQKQENNKKIEAYFNDGCNSNDKEEKLFCAKQINILKAENKSTMNRLIYLSNNISMLNQLKTALDEKDFIKVNKKMNLHQLIDNPTDLAKFLKTLNKDKMYHEEKLSNALDVMEEMNGGYEPNERLFGETQQDNELLAMFEYKNMNSQSIKQNENQVKSFQELIENEEETNDNNKNNDKRRILTNV